MKKTITLLSISLAMLLMAPNAGAQDVGLKWLRDFGSQRDSEFGLAVHTDETGNVYTTGAVGDMINFNRRGSTPVVSGFPGNVGDAFLTKHDTEGNLIWVRTMGGTSSERGNDITTDHEGNIYIIGTFNGTANFDPGGAGNGTLTSAGQTDVFVVKFSSSGVFQWVKKFGGTGGEDGTGIKTDSAGNVYITGSFSDEATFGSTTLTAAGVLYAFVAKLDPAGNTQWAHGFGTGGARGTEHKGQSLALDAEANIYVTGYFAETVDFNPAPGTTSNLISGGATDGFILKLTKDGDYVWAQSMPGPGTGNPQAICTDGMGNVYVAGWFTDSMYLNTMRTGPVLRAHGSIWDGFVARYDAQGTLSWAFALGSPQAEQVLDITTDRSGNVYICGYYEGTLDFDPDPVQTELRTSAGSWDIFVARYSPAGTLVWVKTAGGTGDPGSGAAADVGHGLAVDTAYNVYVTGHYQGSVDFDPGPDTANFTTAGRTDVFIWKLRCPLTESAVTISELCSSAYEWNGIRYTESGIYTHDFYLGEGCDSIATLTLTLGEAVVRPLIQVSGNILSIPSGYSSYQWLMNGTMISGATDSVLIIDANGSYRVIVSNSLSCTDTSDVYDVNNLSVPERHTAIPVRVIPNPARDRVYIHGTRPEYIQLASTDGRVVISARHVSEIQTGGLPAGMYILTAYGTNNTILIREKLLKTD